MNTFVKLIDEPGDISDLGYININSFNNVLRIKLQNCQLDPYFFRWIKMKYNTMIINCCGFFNSKCLFKVSDKTFYYYQPAPIYLPKRFEHQVRVIDPMFDELMNSFILEALGDSLYKNKETDIKILDILINS